jgi:hypothetical protein
VGPYVLRLCFNTYDVVRRVNQGSIRERVKASKRLSAERLAKTDLPDGTYSETVEYFEGDLKLATAHRYVLPSGQIGGSGRPDPKKMVCCGVVLYTRTLAE